MTATFTRDELRQQGYDVRDGRAVKMAETAAAIAESPLVRDLFRSKWERERAAILSLQQIAGDIQSWKYQGIRLRLAEGAWYKPDFLIVLPSGEIILEEVKGFFREAARVRWKVAVEQFPMFTLALLTKRNGAWVTLEYHARRTDTVIPREGAGLGEGR